MRKPLWPSHQRKKAFSERALFTSSRKASFWRAGLIISGDRLKAELRTRKESFYAELFADLVDAGDHIFQFLFGGPTGGLAEAAVGREGEAIVGGVFEAEFDALGDVFGRFD